MLVYFHFSCITHNAILYLLYYQCDLASVSSPMKQSNAAAVYPFHTNTAVNNSVTFVYLKIT